VPLLPAITSPPRSDEAAPSAHWKVMDYPRTIDAMYLKISGLLMDHPTAVEFQQAHHSIGCAIRCGGTEGALG